MRLMHPLGIVAVAVVVLAPRTALAQDYWGVSLSTVPSWTSPERLKVLFDADAVDLSGGEFRIGFARGRTMSGDWGVSYVRKSVKNGSTLVRGDDHFVLGSDVRLAGVEVHKYGVFSTIRDRAQIGMVFAAGVAEAKGTAFGPIGPIEVQEALTTFGYDLGIQPLLRLELAGAAIITHGLKVRVSGGFNWPGTTRVTIAGVYFFGER